MNNELSAIKAKVDDNIAAKAVSNPNPSLVSAADTAEIFEEFLNYLDTMVAPAPSDPDGVFFTTAPGTPTLGATSITETSSVIEVDGVSKSIASTTISIPLAASSKKRKDAIVVNFGATPAVYDKVTGQEVLSTSISPTPVIPTNRLFVRYVDVTDGAVSQSPEVGSTYTDAMAIAAPLTGYTLSDVSGDVAATDSIKAAIQKVEVKANGVPLRLTKTITGNYTVTAADHGYNIKVNSASAVIITLPTGLSGYDIVFKQVGAGAFTFQAGASATVEQFENKFTSAGIKATVSAYSDNANVWTINGQLT